MSSGQAIPADAPPASVEIDEQDAVITRTRRRVLVLTLALVIAAASVLAYRTTALFEAQLAPHVLDKSETVAEWISRDVQRAIGYGIPLDKLVGVPEYFEEKRAGHPEINVIALEAANGRTLHMVGSYVAEQEQAASSAAARLMAGEAPEDVERDTRRSYLLMKPVQGEGGAVAAIVVGTDPQFVRVQLEELAYDVAVIVLVALFLAFEIALALMAASAVAPTRQLLGLLRAGAGGDFGRRLAYRTNNEIGRAIGGFNAVIHRLNDHYARLAGRVGNDLAPDLRDRLRAIGERFGLSTGGPVEIRTAASADHVRLPLFVFILAEEMQKSFLPLYVSSLEGHVGWLSPQILIGLPISIYMLTLALATPFAGSWADRYGARRIFLLGLVPSLLGFVGTALATSVLELIVCRALTAAGYAMCTIAAQGFIIQVTASQERTRGVSIFVGVLMAASICGTAIGGILADRVGYRAVFVFAAVLVLIAGAIALRMLSSSAAGPVETAARRLKLGDLRLVLHNWRFVGLILFAAIPGKVVLTGFLFYAVPLYLASLGTSEAEIGRVMISYSLVIVFLGPWLSRIADEKGYGWWMVFAGTLVSGLAMVLPWLWPDLLGVLAAVIAVALAHAASISPQIALIPEICAKDIEEVGQTAVLGMLRTLERIGSVVGPLLVASLVASFGFVDGLLVLGVTLAVISPMLLIVFPKFRPSRGS